jgi:hypothetical protein
MRGLPAFSAARWLRLRAGFVDYKGVKWVRLALFVLKWSNASMRAAGAGFSGDTPFEGTSFEFGSRPQVMASYPEYTDERGSRDEIFS